MLEQVDLWFPKNIWLDLPGLNCIEMNSTFYALPSATTVKNWKNLSDNLYFSIKMFQIYYTYETIK